MNVQSTLVTGSATDGKIDDPNAYRQVLGAFMTGVTVITTVDKEGRKRGITANSFTSVSLDPPLVLFCIDYRAASYETFQNADGFVVHILSSDQQELAKTFASKSEQKFEGQETTSGVSGAPRLNGVHGWLDCTSHDVVVAGDHAIVIGEVKQYSTEPARPLGFYQGRFFGFNNDQEISSLVPPSASINVGWILQSQDGKIVASKQGGELTLPKTKLRANRINSESLTAEASNVLNAPASVEFLYSVYESDSGGLTLIYRGESLVESAELSSNGFTCLAIDQTKPEDFKTPGETAVVRRYLTELANESFGLYAGTLAEGMFASVDGIRS